MKLMRKGYLDSKSNATIPRALRKQRLWFRLDWVLLALGAILLSIPATAAPLRIGTISADPAKDVKEFQPLAAYLGSRLGKRDIDSGVVVIAQDVREMANMLKTDKIDLYVDSPFPVLLTQRLADNKILLRRWKKGVQSYSGVIFTRRDSGFAEIKQLSGKMIAFEEPFSTASYYLAKAHLIHAGLKMSRKADSRDKVEPNEVGYVFSDDDRNTMAWVMTGKVSAGAMNDEKYKKLAKGREQELLILATTMVVPRHLVTYRKNLDALLVNEIRSLLVEMEHAPAGLAALKAFNETTRFDDLNEADHKELERLRVTYDVQINNELSGKMP